MVKKREKVYTFKGKRERGTKWVKYSIPELNLKRAKIRAKRKWGNKVVLSSGKVNKRQTNLRYKTRWV